MNDLLIIFGGAAFAVGATIISLYALELCERLRDRKASFTYIGDDPKNGEVY